MNRYKNIKKAAQTYAKLKPDLNGIRSIYTDIRITNCSKINSIVNFSCKDYINTIKQHDFKVLEMFNRQLVIEMYYVIIHSVVYKERNFVCYVYHCRYL